MSANLNAKVMPSMRRPNSNQSAVRRLFEENPGEEYRYVDLKAKFSHLSDMQMREIVKQLTAEGTICSVHAYRSTLPSPTDQEFARLRKRIGELKAELAAVREQLQAKEVA